MHPAACAKLRGASIQQEIRDISDAAARPGGGTIDAHSRQRGSSNSPLAKVKTAVRARRGGGIVIIAVSIQMITLGLIFVGAVIVLLGSMLNPQQVDPMGMFGLPSVYAVACEPVNMNSRAVCPIEIGSRSENRQAA
jgi:hypothetical protein